MRRTLIIGVGGFLVVLALALWVANMRGMLPGYSRLLTYTDDASGLTDGTKVRIEGIPIGYLDHQHLTGSRNRSRAVEFELKVKSSYLEKIPVDSKVRVVADNLLGDKAINILPGTAPQHVVSGAVLKSDLAVDPNKIMAQMSNTLQQFQQIMDRANALLTAVDAGQGSIGKLQTDWNAKWSKLPLEMNKLMADYSNAHGSANRIFVDNSELLGEIQTTQKRFDDIMGAFQSGQGTAGKLPGIQKEFDQTTREFNALNTAMQSRSANVNELQQRLNALMQRFNGILDKANAGQGTYGQFLINSQLSEAMAGSSREFQTLMKDMRANPKKFFSFRLQLF